jgi:glutaredoxin 3
MALVELYGTIWCGYSARARRLLHSKGVEFRDIDIESVSGARQEMQSRAQGAKTVPQIFINHRHIGGCDDLYALEAAGELDPLLAQAG